MKDGLVLFVLGLIGIGGFLLWQTHGDLFRTASVSAPVESNVQPAPAAPAPKPAPRVKPAPRPVVETPAVVVEAVAAPEPPPAPPVVPQEPPPFPAVEEIANGALSEAVTTKFGDPTLSMLTSNGGRMRGTYVYARDKGREATVVQMEDGRVATAYSKNAPVPASGLSIPRQKHSEQPHIE